MHNDYGQVVRADSARILLLYSIWKDSLLFPAYFAAISAFLLILRGVLSSRPVRALLARVDTSGEPVFDDLDVCVTADAPPSGGIFADVKMRINAVGGPGIFVFKMLRLGSCLCLMALSIATFVVNEHDRETSHLSVLKKKKKKGKHATSDAFTEEEWLQISLCLTYVYSSFLALLSVSMRCKWAQMANKHLVSLLLFTWAVVGYRDAWPLATYNQQPVDISDRLLWPKFLILTVTAIAIPLLIPRPYTPVDPKEPAEEPNPEQTAPLLSLLLYSFLDTIIFKAYRVPHLPLSEFPPLADYDRAKNLKARSFKYLDYFSGARREHLFFGLMRVFHREYIGIVTMTVIRVMTLYASPIGINKLLHYLETGGEGATVRPWVWISWLFFGPVFSTIAMQWYIFLTTGTLVRCEGIITQLVFEHALRIRMKAQSSSESSTSGSSTVYPTPETASVAESDANLEGTTLNGTEVQPSSAYAESDSSKGKKKGIDTTSSDPSRKSTSSTDNLIGKLNNLVTTDLQNIVDGRDFPLLIIQSPLLVAVGIALLYTFLGWSAFVGLAVMLLLFPIPGYVAKLTQTVQRERMRKTDDRVQTVTETMNVIRMIKLFGWEPKMNEQIQEKRDEELRWIKIRQLLDISNGTINFLIPVVTMIATFVTYTIIMKQQLRASVVFSSTAVFDMLRDQLHLIFFFIPACIQAKVSLDRITEYLRDTELLDEFQRDKKGSADQIEFSAAPRDPTFIGFCDASFVWSNVDGSLTPSRRKFRLTIDNELVFQLNAVNLIIGPTGSGKTSMLMALLGEMHFLPSGPVSWFNLPRDKGVAYAAQESWVQNETIRDNILFGAPYDEERYKKVIYQCGLVRDLTLFDAGDQTEVGERGLTLSGGQKARITLARAVYSSADIILLDDVLAALDVHTSRWIVEKCLQGDLVKGRTVILTHNVSMVSPIASFVACLGTDGRVASRGTVAETIATDKEMQAEIEKSEEENKKQEEASALDGDHVKDVGASGGKLTVAEEIAEGHVNWKAVKLYLSNLGGPLFWFCFLGSMFVVDLGNVTQTWYLGYWAAQYETHDPSEVSVPYHLSVFSAIILFGVIMYFVGYYVYVYGSIRASRTIHRRLIAAITVGWILLLQAVSLQDARKISAKAIDGPVSQNLGWVIELTISLLIRLAAVVYMTPTFIFPGLLVGIVGTWLGNIYIKAQLSVKREMSNAKSPVLNHFGAAVAGLVSIRAFGVQDKFKSESLARIDRYVRSGRTFYNLNRWVSVRIDILSGAFAVGLATYLVYGHQLGSASNTGFSLNMAGEPFTLGKWTTFVELVEVAFSSMILWWVRILNQFEVSGNSLERIQDYVDIEQEPKPTDKGVTPAYWPSSGGIQVEKLSARYSPTGPKVLHDVSFEIRPGERVGVVGRTGSGKSSLTLSLLRCIVTDGKVYYDGLPTDRINLDILRRNITIIPQVPELLSGTLRHNLDPFSEHDDAVLYNALRSAGLFSLQNEDSENKITLDTQIAAGGSNLSVGQRQILALARAIVRGSKLLILDEATSAIDHDTDSVIQRSLRHELGRGVTLITVAHRLQTIMDSDKIMVLDAGRIVEFDKPANLLQKENGFLKSLVDRSGDRDTLYAMASAKW